MTTETGIKNLSTISDVTDAQKTITTTGNTQFGDGNTKTVITHDTARAVLKSHQWRIKRNPDGSPVLILGSEQHPTLIIDSYHNNNWGTGGNFRGINNEKVKLKFINCNYINTYNSRESKFGGNAMELITEAYRSNFGFSAPAATPFFGMDGIFEDVSIVGASDTDINNAMFLGLPRRTKNLLIKNWYIGLKIEFGVAFYGQIQFEDCAYHGFAMGDGQTSGKTDNALNYVNSIFDKSKVIAVKNAPIRIWRTVRLSARKADGTPVPNVKLFTMQNDQNTNFELTMSASVTSEGYRCEDHDRHGRTGVNEMMYYFRVGDMVKIEGFTNPNNNGTFLVTGKTEDHIAYPDKRILYTSNPNLANETTKSNIKITRIPPGSDGAGKFHEHPIQIIEAIVKNVGTNNPTSGKSLDRLLLGFDAQAGYYERKNWKLVMMPPYPLERKSIDAVLQPDSSTEPFYWSPIMQNDKNLTETDPARVAAYAKFDNWDQVYDYLDWHQRQNGKENFPREDMQICTKKGKQLDFGSIDVDIQKSATNVVDVSGNRVRLRADLIATTSRITEIKTAGTITASNGAKIQGIISDSTADSTVEFHIPLTYQIMGIFASSADATSESNKIADVDANKRWRYLASQHAGATVFIRLEKIASGQGHIHQGSIIEQYAVEATAGIYSHDIVSSPINTALEHLDSVVEENNKLIKELWQSPDSKAVIGKINATLNNAESIKADTKNTLAVFEHNEHTVNHDWGLTKADQQGFALENGTKTVDFVSEYLITNDTADDVPAQIAKSFSPADQMPNKVDITLKDKSFDAEDRILSVWIEITDSDGNTHIFPEIKNANWNTPRTVSFAMKSLKINPSSTVAKLTVKATNPRHDKVGVDSSNINISRITTASILTFTEKILDDSEKTAKTVKDNLDRKITDIPAPTKNTEAEIRDAATKALQQLPDSDKDTYKTSSAAVDLDPVISRLNYLKEHTTAKIINTVAEYQFTRDVLHGITLEANTTKEQKSMSLVLSNAVNSVQLNDSAQYAIPNIFEIEVKNYSFTDKAFKMQLLLTDDTGTSHETDAIIQQINSNGTKKFVFDVTALHIDQGRKMNDLLIKIWNGAVGTTNFTRGDDIQVNSLVYKKAFDKIDRIISTSNVIKLKLDNDLDRKISDIPKNIELALLDESDQRRVIDAIVRAIGNTNITAAAIRIEMEKPGYTLSDLKTIAEKLRFNADNDVVATLDGERVGADLTLTNQKIDNARNVINSISTDTSSMKTKIDDNLDGKISEVRAALANIAADAETIRKIQANRYDIEQTTTEKQTGTIYEDDGTTVFKRFTITITPGTNRKVIEWI